MSARSDAVGYLGHRVHLCRALEVGRLLSWAGDLTGTVLLDVAGGDGYWATVARRAGARAVSLDLDAAKAARGLTYDGRAALVLGDALRLPVADASVDVILSVCAIEHFDDGPAALDEMSRVLRPGGRLVMSADCLSGSERHVRQRDRHVQRYHVQDTYDHNRLRNLLADRGLELRQHDYLFQAPWARRLYLGVSAYGGRFGWNLAAPLALPVAWSDRRRDRTAGSVVLVHAVKLG